MSAQALNSAGGTDHVTGRSLAHSAFAGAPMTYHVAAGLHYLTSASPTELEGMFNDEQGNPLPAEDIIKLATALKARGYEVLPPCDHHDERGYCQGHPA